MIWRSLGKAYDWELEKFRVMKINIMFRCKKNSQIEVIREDFSKISSDLLNIQLDIFIGRHSKLDSLKAES